MLIRTTIFDSKWLSHLMRCIRPHLCVTFDISISFQLCKQAIDQLRKQPDSLGSLELEYVLHGTRGARKQITVTGQHLLQGKMYAKLRNEVDPKGNIYLNSNDLNTFVQEAVSNIVASATTDADYVDTCIVNYSVCVCH